MLFLQKLNLSPTTVRFFVKTKENTSTVVKSLSSSHMSQYPPFTTFLIAHFQTKLELMFMKHYAPNRCLYIKVAKLRTGLRSAEMSHLQNCSLKIYLKSTGGGGGGLVRMDVNEELKFLGKFRKGGGGGSGGGGGFRVDVNKVFVKIQKKKNGGGGWVGGVRVDVNKELKFLGKFTKKKSGWGGGGVGWGGGVRWGVGLVGGGGGQGECERNVGGRG